MKGTAMQNNLNTPENHIIIKSSRLKVEIASPAKIYRRARFDWTGFITQVTLDNRHTFCVPENYNPDKGTGGAGFCNEFGIDLPVGYDDAKVGEWFTKISVGLLKRYSKGPYDFFSPFEIKAFPSRVSSNAESAEFFVEPIECMGYSVRLHKIVSISDNILKIHYKLENTGSKTIVTSEYCHNFMGIDGCKIGKDYCLTFPTKIKVNKVKDGFVLYENKIHWDVTPSDEFYGLIENFPGSVPYLWELVHEPTGAGVRDISKLSISKIALWGRDHAVCPEIFIEINLEPNKIMEWSREYEFFCK
jgi:hypothetical protein